MQPINFLTHGKLYLFVGFIFYLSNSAPLYMSVAEDSAGQTHITSCCILYDETAESLKWYISQIINVMPNLTQSVRTIITDKHHTLRKCLKELFPSSKLMICLFHVSQSFRREVTTSKYNITREKRDQVLEILSKIIYSKNKREFEILCSNLFQQSTPKFIDYFK